MDNRLSRWQIRQGWSDEEICERYSFSVDEWHRAVNGSTDLPPAMIATLTQKFASSLAVLQKAIVELPQRVSHETNHYRVVKNERRRERGLSDAPEA